MDLNELVESAKSGNAQALEKVIVEIQDKVYGLSLKMLYDPMDASDATQEILIKVITNIGSFRGESLFTTWVYRIAVNYLLTRKKRKSEISALSFDEYEDDLDLERSGKWLTNECEPLDKQFLDEIRISCLQGLLLCLTRELRIVFLLVDVFDIDSAQGADILEITPATFRKRLSRAREKIQSFLFKNCSLIKRENKCKCGYHVASQLGSERFNEKNLRFSKLPSGSDNIFSNEKILNEMDELNQIGFLYKTNPEAKTPEVFIQNIRQLLNSGRFIFLNN